MQNLLGEHTPGPTPDQKQKQNKCVQCPGVVCDLATPLNKICVLRDHFVLPFPNLDLYAFEAEESLCEEDSNLSTAV